MNPQSRPVFSNGISIQIKRQTIFVVNHYIIPGICYITYYIQRTWIGFRSDKGKISTFIRKIKTRP